MQGNTSEAEAESGASSTALDQSSLTLEDSAPQPHSLGAAAVEVLSPPTAAKDIAEAVATMTAEVEATAETKTAPVQPYSVPDGVLADLRSAEQEGRGRAGRPKPGRADRRGAG